MKKKLLGTLLATILFVTPIMQSVHAAEVGNELTSLTEKISTGDVLDLKSFNYTSIDSENQNIGYIEGEGHKSIVNMETGDIVHKYYNEDGTLKESYKTNYYENLGVEDQNDLESRKEIISNKAGKLYYSVNRTTRDYITIKNSKGVAKNYSKAQNTYYGGNTKKFMDKVDDAASPYRSMVGVLTAALIVSLVAYLGITNAVITVAMMKTALGAIGAATLVTLTVAFINKMTDLYNSYRRVAISADHIYNSI